MIQLIFNSFKSNSKKRMTFNPELDYFKNESVSDVIFVVKGHRLPAMKAILSLKSRVFRAMFSGDFKESKDKEIVIEDTTFEAFESFLRFLYCDELVLKDDNDFKLIRELFKLCDRYDVSRLMFRLTQDLYEKAFSLVWKDMYSSEDYNKVRPEFQSISKIAFEFKLEEVMKKVMEFIDKNFDHILNEDNNALIQLNDSTENRLITLMADKCHKTRNDFSEYKERVKQIYQVNCQNCHRVNHVPSVSGNYECWRCTGLYSVTIDLNQLNL